MKKIEINGQQYIRVRELREEIRHLRKNIDVLYENFDKDHRAMVHLAYNDVVKAVYREELDKARTPDEIRAVLEMPGDFVVVKLSNPVVSFTGWKDGEPEFGTANDGLIFSYESKAKEVAEQLGEGWKVLDVSPEESERTKRFFKALFGDDDARAIAALADEFLEGNDSEEAKRLKKNIKDNTERLL